MKLVFLIGSQREGSLNKLLAKEILERQMVSSLLHLSTTTQFQALSRT